MSYNISIKFLYTITTIIIGTFICINFIQFNYHNLVRYYSYDAKTTGYIVTDKCLFDLPENAHIVDLRCQYAKYTVDGVKYLKELNQFLDLDFNTDTDKEVNILYKKNNPTIYVVDDKSNINSFIILFSAILILILLWVLLLIIIVNDNYYTNYIHLFYAFSLTISISYYCVIIINSIYYYTIGNYIEYNSFTSGIVKDKDTIEYSINNVNKTFKYSSSFYDFKSGDKVTLLYDKNNIEHITIYEVKSKIKDLVKAILLIICLLLLWVFLIYNISYILN